MNEYQDGKDAFKAWKDAGSPNECCPADEDQSDSWRDGWEAAVDSYWANFGI